MNAVEIEEAVCALIEAPFDREQFPFAFLEAFGNKKTTIDRLRKGVMNRSDIGGVLQRNHIHILATEQGGVEKAMDQLRNSLANRTQRPKFLMATDGELILAENLIDGEAKACDSKDLPNHFGFFLALAGISTTKPIRENAFDIKATGRLNKLYLELLKTNPDWAAAEKREDLNHFLARLIFCFFAEDTGIFHGEMLFTSTIQQMSDPNGSNTHEVLQELFKAMSTPPEKREEAQIRPYADIFPYVNGGLFSGVWDCPQFSRIARTYLTSIGALDWKRVNPDIFGSMIQAVADDEERGSIGMHYTSVPNILKVLNPLFLDDLRAQLEEAGENGRKLLNLRQRLAKIRVFDPACGSGNFLVIAYKEMREIEKEINQRRNDPEMESVIPLSNFRGIEIRHFSAEIARLALVIAKFQCDVLSRGELLAKAVFLPLERDNWIVCGNALRLDWLNICPPTGTGVKIHANDLLSSPLEQVEIDFENEGGETYICGNPPYRGSQTQTSEQKRDLFGVAQVEGLDAGQLDYVAAWFIKAARMMVQACAKCAFVSTNSICQGRIVAKFWGWILGLNVRIEFAHTSFRWANLASSNAGVTVVVIGLSLDRVKETCALYEIDDRSIVVRREVDYISPYLVPGRVALVISRKPPVSNLPEMQFGNMPVDGGNLLFSRDQVNSLGLNEVQMKRIVKRIYGAEEFIRGRTRFCLWIEDKDYAEAYGIAGIRDRVMRVRSMRLASKDKGTRSMAERSHQMREMNIGKGQTVVVPIHSSESRPFLPVGLIDGKSTVTNACLGLFDAPLWCLSLIASKLHLVWIATVCGKLKTDYRYSNTLGWNTFPVPPLTEQNKADLTHCAEEILLAREAHWPATIADLYDPNKMPEDLRLAHDRNDETLERIYIGRRFRNDTERLEKLFEMYSKMTKKETA